MVWGAIGGAAVGVIGNAILGGSKGGGGGGGSSSGGGGGGSSSSNNPVAVADPFADQRYQYQAMLQDLIKGNTWAKNDPGAQSIMNTIAMGGTAAPLQQQANAMLQPGYKFDSSDPSYQWRLDQGLDAVNRSAAKSGLLGAGNRLTALQDYGQGAASQEFQAEYARKSNAVQQAAGLDQSHFAEANQIDQGVQQFYNNNYQRLAQLSGANISNPSVAANLLANQQAGAAAQYDKYGNLLVKGVKGIYDWATDGGGGSSGAPSLHNGGSSYGSAGDFDYSGGQQSYNNDALQNIDW